MVPRTDGIPQPTGPRGDDGTMGLLKKIEKKLENAVEGLFAKGFKSKVEPVELGKKLSLAMINNKVVALKKVWAPNEFEITLSIVDSEQYESYKKELVHELADFLVQEASAEGLSMMGRPKLNFKSSEDLAKGQFEINVKMSEEQEKEISKTTDGATQLIPLSVVKVEATKHFIQVEPLMLRYDLKPGKTLIGRSSTNDISIADPALSRHHFEINIEEEEAIVRDLNTTNGTKINNKLIKSSIARNQNCLRVVIILGK